MDDHDELAQTLLDDDQPSWVTLSKGVDDNSGLDGGGDGGGRGGEDRSSAWDRRSSNAGRKNSTDELPSFIRLLRILNMGAAILLIYGSVRIGVIVVYLSLAIAGPLVLPSLSFLISDICAESFSPTYSQTLK